MKTVAEHFTGCYAGLLANPNVCHAVLRYVHEGQPFGQFLTAVFSNDLFEAVGRADDDMARELKYLVMWIVNKAPMACHGSPANVKAWIERGGLKGKRVKQEQTA